ncbi:MAG: pentapeptide repeat-containing protein, partial [Pirellulales bacterium]
MSDVISHGAVVRPRVVLRPEEGPRLLEDIVAELADELPAGFVWIVGGPGSGKTTAIAYLSTQFGDDPRLALLDEPTREQLDAFAESKLVLATAAAPRDRKGVVLRLSKWGCDDLVEYLLAVYPADCRSVMTRLGAGVRKNWTPQLACAIVQRLATDESVADAEAALTAEIASRLGNPTHLAVAAEYCFAWATKDHELLQSTTYALARVGCPQSVLSLMRHEEVQHPLAGAAVMTALTTRKSLRKLLRLPRELVRIVGSRCRDNAQAIQRLRGVLTSSNASTVQPMAASILSIADRTWRPEGDKDRPCFLSQGMFEGANWAQAGLAHANLRQADLNRANLVGANLVEADATESVFAAADLSGARLIGLRAARADFSGSALVNAKLALLQAAHASFSGADLRGANLVKADLAETDLTGANLAKADLFCARLIGAVFEDADFTDANLDEAYLTKVDLRRAVLAGVSFKGAYMTHVQMEDVVLPHAQLERAHLNYAQLTGSRLPAANLRGARLVFAQLAEIDWPAADLHGADLFGASFHMGSSRSGLVGSPIACEGSKTGFYTDDREEMYFKRPEEIRKANLRGADLRGARIDG